MCDIQAQTLIISGAWDPVTPSRCAKVMARRMPNAKHIEIPRSTHFSLLERPKQVVPAIVDFLAERADEQAAPAQNANLACRNAA